VTTHHGVLMCPPTYFEVRDVKNPFMASGGVVNRERALEQWEALRHAFERAGVTTATIEPVEDLEDMVFAANQVFVGSTAAGARFIVPSRMRYASREREVPHYVRWFAERGFDVLELGLDDEDYLEGHGDLLWHPGSRHVWAGYGFRSSRGGVARFAAAMEPQRITVTPLELIDETFYHLDTCFAPLDEEAALVFAPALSEASLEILRAAWPRLHEVSREDAYRFACNGVAVNGHFIASHLSGAVAAIVSAEGLEPTIVDTSEFEKAGGSIFCLKTFLD